MLFDLFSLCGEVLKAEVCTCGVTVWSRVVFWALTCIVCGALAGCDCLPALKADHLRRFWQKKGLGVRDVGCHACV